MIDPFVDLVEEGNHSTTERPTMYLEHMTLTQRELFWVSRQIFFPTRAFENRRMFLSPHPPKYLGVTIEFQFD
jgi:hypothetical protein